MPTRLTRIPPFQRVTVEPNVATADLECKAFHITENLFKKSCALISDANQSTEYYAIIDEGSTHHFQSTENNARLLHGTTIVIPKIKIGIGEGHTFAEKAAFALHISPKFNDDSIGVAYVAPVILVHPWRRNLVLICPELLARSIRFAMIDAHDNSNPNAVPFLLARETYKPLVENTTNDSPKDLPAGTLACVIKRAPNGLRIVRHHTISDFAQILSARTGKQINIDIELAFAQKTFQADLKRRKTANIALSSALLTYTTHITLRMILICPGLCIESTAEYLRLFHSHGFECHIVAFSEVDSDVNKFHNARAHAKSLWPNAFDLGDANDYASWPDIPHIDIVKCDYSYRSTDDILKLKPRTSTYTISRSSMVGCFAVARARSLVPEHGMPSRLCA